MPAPRLARPDDLPAALEVWRAAKSASGGRPAAARVDRVRDKLADPAALVVVAPAGPAEDGPAEDGPAEVMVAMALGEPGRAGDGSPRAGLLHLSMLFVRPDARRRGHGTALLTALTDEAWLQGYRRLSVWTREGNAAARAFYEAAGLAATGRHQTLPDGSPAVHYAAELAPPLREVVVRDAGLRLGQLLKLAGLVDTGSQAKELLAAGEVSVNGEVETRRGCQLTDGDVVEARDQAVRVVLRDPSAAPPGDAVTAE